MLIELQQVIFILYFGDTLFDKAKMMFITIEQERFFHVSIHKIRSGYRGNREMFSGWKSYSLYIFIHTGFKILFDRIYKP